MRIRRLWPLFLGLAILGLCVGIQGTLLGVRASMEGFGTRAVGLIMSGYFLGFILGAVRAPRAIRRVGHVRTFGALTALASISVLVHPLVIEPWTWFFLRVVTGFAFSGIYVVAESWLNHASNQENRGRVLSLYATVLFAGLGGGQLLLGLLDAESYEVFSWVSVLISFAAIPILIFTTPAPVAEEVTRVSVRRLFQWAPYGVVSVFLAQVGGAVLVGMGAVYAHSLQMDLGQISLFMAALIFGGFFLQWPLGKWSDRLDRRKVVAACALVAALVAALLAARDFSDFRVLLLASALLGGMIFPLYALSIAMINDFMRPEKIVAAAGTIVLISGVGSTLGPFLVSLGMERFGPVAFFWFLSAVYLVLAALGVYRVASHHYVPTEDKHEYSIYAPAQVGNMLQADTVQNRELAADTAAETDADG